MRVAPPCDTVRIGALRRGLNVSQGVFAALLIVGLTAVQAWEQGRRIPDGASPRPGVRRTSPRDDPGGDDVGTRGSIVVYPLSSLTSKM